MILRLALAYRFPFAEQPLCGTKTTSRLGKSAFCNNRDGIEWREVGRIRSLLRFLTGRLEVACLRWRTYSSRAWKGETLALPTPSPHCFPRLCTVVPWPCV